MFDADRPILSSDQDRLNRTFFAKYLARCILDHADPDSLVIGLYGGWGVGKSSVINMVLQELNFAATNLEDDQKPIILNFSPWSYSGQGQLIYSFFRRLSSTLRTVPKLKNANRVIHLLELYVSFFTHRPIPKALRTKRTLWQKLTFRNREEIYAWESGRDLTLIKAELNELLRHQSHKIIIIIDNISQLYNDEIKQIFQIVKSMGDYTNTVYLLALDKEHVINAINKLDGKGGAEYIEKIVQLPFVIPPITQQDLEKIFADRLNDVIATVPIEAWQTEYWADLYYGSLRLFFENCRDITRYVNVLNFSYPRMRDVVNPVDFFALTAIEVFLPQVYYGIRDNKDLFTDLLDRVYALDEDQIQKERLRCDEIIKGTTRISAAVVLELLTNLFPRLKHIYQPDIHFYYSDASARKLKRISSPDLFDTYFRLSMQLCQLPPSEFETILLIANDAEAFDQALSRLNQDDKILKFLDMLDSRVLQAIPPENIQAIMSALLDNGDLFPRGIVGPLSLDTPIRIHRIVHGLLSQIKQKEERFNILQNAIAAASKSIYIIIHELEEQNREHLEEPDTFIPSEFRDLTIQQVTSLQKLSVSRIQYWAETQRLVDHPRLLAILYAWRNWGNEADCCQYVAEITQTDRGLIAFLQATLGEAITQAMTKYEKTADWEKYLHHIDAFISVKSLEAHTKILFEDEYFEKLKEQEQLALMIFLDLIKSDTCKIIPKTTT